MSSDEVQRKLSAILSADVKGYSRLMGHDEQETVRTLNKYKKLMAGIIQDHRGRVVDAPGDNLLAEFASAVDAVHCAAEVQKELMTRNAELTEQSRMEFRIGINLGDVIEEEGRVYGEGVNIAARIESLADGGGVCISGTVYDQVWNKLGLNYEYLGEQFVKNIAHPVRVYRILTESATVSVEMIDQQIKFCTSEDGVNIAYCTAGKGNPLVKAANWLSHTELYWVSPVTRHWPRDLSKNNFFVMYDGRGTGLSDWNMEDNSFDAWIRDLEAVVDSAGLHRFNLLGISGGSAISIAYAVRHPERVAHLILYGAFARGWAKLGLPQSKLEALFALAKVMEIGWGGSNPAYRQIFTTLFVPEANTEFVRSFNEMERKSTSPAMAAKFWVEIGKIDVLDMLPKVRVPTLVLHALNDKMAPFDGGRQVAASIPGARFVPIESKNHLLQENEPAWHRFLTEIHRFIGTNDKHEAG
ncbi:MAG: alpha/beta fold hydrolase [Deltaproteobacteria bacterium]|nr:alpha/beta fold hydrolase [Deltaproteobacteria bacterium]